MLPLVSIVIPTHNERDNINALCERLFAVFQSLPDYQWEIIFVDDSSDATPDIIKAVIERDVRVKLIRLVRSFGQSATIAAGLKRAEGEAVILMDADLQDPPEVIPVFLEKWHQGNKVVYAQRPSQSASILYKVLARSFYKILAVISDVRIPIDAGEFRLLDRAVVDFLNSLNERSRFLRGLTVWPGFPSDKVEIVRGERLSGTTNYNLAKSFTVAMDGFVSFSIAPLRIATVLGLISAAALFGGRVSYFMVC
jgi:dolichol-phosphate mannosyltransferase